MAEKKEESYRKIRPKRAWHITDFEEVFKMTDDVRKGRKGPLAYTKSFVSLSGLSKPCETHHYERLRDLKARPERHLLRSIFEDLKNWTAHKPQNFQGYLVTHSGRPADYDYICAQLDNVDKEELKRAIFVLSQIGLIERVALNGQFCDKHDKDSKNTDAPDCSGNCPDDSGEGPDDSGKGVDSLLNDKGKVKALAAPEKRKASGDKTTVAEDEDKENGNDMAKPTQAPTTTPLPSAVKPCESDLGGEAEQDDSGSPPGTVNRPVGKQRPGMVHHKGDYEKWDLIYGSRIFGFLGLSKNKNRESSSFASKWHECRCKLWDLPPPEIDKIGIRGIRQAEKIAKQKNCNKSKVWNNFMDKITNATLREKIDFDGAA